MANTWKHIENAPQPKECERWKRLDEIIKIKWKITSHIEMDEFSSELSVCFFFCSFIFIILWNWLSFFSTPHTLTNTSGKKALAFYTQNEEKNKRFSSGAFVRYLWLAWWSKIKRRKWNEERWWHCYVGGSIINHARVTKQRKVEKPLTAATTNRHLPTLAVVNVDTGSFQSHLSFHFSFLRVSFSTPQRIEAIFDYSLWWWLWVNFSLATFFIHYISTNLYAMYGSLLRSHLPTKKAHKTKA